MPPAAVSGVGGGPGGRVAGAAGLLANDKERSRGNEQDGWNGGGGRRMHCAKPEASYS